MSQLGDKYNFKATQSTVLPSQISSEKAEELESTEDNAAAAATTVKMVAGAASIV